MGILEYLSQTNKNTDIIDPEDKLKFIDNMSVLEIINLISLGISSFNFKSQVASDINTNHNQFINQSNLKSQAYLNEIATWTRQNLMKLNTEKSNFMIVNFTENHQFNTRLNIENN